MVIVDGRCPFTTGGLLALADLIGTDPRVIADEVWAKLLWAGLNLEAADLVPLEYSIQC